MKILKHILCICFSMLLFSCGSNGNDNTGTVDQDKTKWFRTDDGNMEIVSCYSDNYYKINGRKIALCYTFLYWASSPYEVNKFVCGFSFIDTTNETGEGQNKPSFSTQQGANNKLVLMWENGQSSTLTMDKVEPSQLLMFNPWAEKFQRILNENKKFSVNVTLADGQTLNFKIDISQRGSLNI